MAVNRQNAQDDKGLYMVGVLAWLIPGAGHWYLGHRKRAIVICSAVCTCYLLGIMLGSIEVVDPQHSRIWFGAQILAGLPTLLTTLLQNSSVSISEVFGRGVDLGQVYTGISGLLNLLCILDALVRKPIDVSAVSPCAKPAE